VTRVVNAYKEKPDVFIGRWTSAPRIREIWGEIEGLNGDYGNPHPVGQPCKLCQYIRSLPDGLWTGNVTHATAEEAVAAFRETFNNQIDDPEIRAKVLRLQGKTLGCLGDHRPCHGDVYIEWLEKQVSEAPRANV
jgi:hypothetical protein